MEILENIKKQASLACSQDTILGLLSERTPLAQAYVVAEEKLLFASGPGRVQADQELARLGRLLDKECGWYRLLEIQRRALAAHNLLTNRASIAGRLVEAAKTPKATKSPKAAKKAWSYLQAVRG